MRLFADLAQAPVVVLNGQTRLLGRAGAETFVRVARPNEEMSSI